MGQGWTHAKPRRVVSDAISLLCERSLNGSGLDSREGAKPRRVVSDAIFLLRDYGAINNWKALSIHNATALTGATRH